MMPNNHNTDVSAMAFLNRAREYHEAVEELFHSKPRLTNVLYALYFHVTESLLKAYLRAHNGQPEKNHKIGALYNDCRGLGLKISSDDEFDLENIVSLLESGNADAGFRYFSMKSGSIPDLGWTREVVGQLMQVVAPFVESKNTAPSGRVVKLQFMFRRPHSVGGATSEAKAPQA
jgi:HEPN domain-containing protein